MNFNNTVLLLGLLFVGLANADSYKYYRYQTIKEGDHNHVCIQGFKYIKENGDYGVPVLTSLSRTDQTTGENVALPDSKHYGLNEVSKVFNQKNKGGSKTNQHGGHWCTWEFGVVQVEFESPEEFANYQIDWEGTSCTNYAKEWKILASNDATTWVEVDHEGEYDCNVRDNRRKNTYGLSGATPTNPCEGKNEGDSCAHADGASPPTCKAEATCQSGTCTWTDTNVCTLDSGASGLCKADDTCSAACSAFTCFEDSKLKPNSVVLPGSDWNTCCQCSFGQKTGHAVVPEGKFNAGTTPTFTLKMDFASNHEVKSIKWKGAEDDSLAYTKDKAGFWATTNPNECKKELAITKDLGTFFGKGSKFELKNGDQLVSLVTVESIASISQMFGTHEVNYERTYKESVPIIVGLSRTKTVSADVSLNPSSNRPINGEQGFIYVEGYANDMDGDSEEIKLTLHIETDNCVKEDASHTKVTGGANHVQNEKFVFSTPAYSNGICSQTCDLSFKAKGYFKDTITLQFETKVTNSKFKIDAEVEYVESSVLDYIPFDTEMKFYGKSDRQTEQDAFKLGEHIYGTLKASPLVQVPIANMELESLVTKQTNPSGGADIVTDILNDATSTYQYQGAFQTGTGKFNFEFDLESLRFVTSVGGTPCTVEGKIKLTYQDGTTLRRSLRRSLGGKEESIDGSFMIFEDEFAMAAASTAENESSCLLKIGVFALMGLAAGYGISSYRRRGDKVSILM